MSRAREGMKMAPPIDSSKTVVVGNPMNMALYMPTAPRRRRGCQQRKKIQLPEHLYLIRKLPVTGRNKRVL